MTAQAKPTMIECRQRLQRLVGEDVQVCIEYFPMQDDWRLAILYTPSGLYTERLIDPSEFLVSDDELKENIVDASAKLVTETEKQRKQNPPIGGNAEPTPE